ncbi:tetraacyldisaccharide 4'-kinase [Spongiimicrobium sp. 3-5]|uniref:tetraacyldisaccharide 4'-kinase n=1 Tax=Spongiimicrobium sp. 3-5 TaxID=3332596 RepID=UPI00397F5D71
MQLLRKIGFPISLIYAVVVYIRNILYDKGIFSSETFKTKTVCVGNLSTGGTGKTPMIEFLVAALKDDFKLAVLSRGYGRKSKGFLKAGISTLVSELGDEPFQIHTKFPEITVVVDEDRRNAISILEQGTRPDIVLLDDAYQHRKVTPRYAILLTAFNKLYCDDWYLPTGDLRDGRRQAKRADVIVVTKCPENLDALAQEKIVRRLKINTNQQVLFSTLEYDTHVKGPGNTLSLGDLKTQNVTLVTGIADPTPLTSFLSQQKINFEHLSFRDHHFFTENEIALFNTKDLVLTTEKDFVRLKGKVSNLYYLGVKHRFLNDGKEVLLGAIKAL